jgi:DNA polymerase-1
LQKRLIAAGALPADILEPEQRLKAWLRSARRAATKAGERRPQKGDAPAHILHPYLYADVVSTRVLARTCAAAVNGQADVLDLERRCIPAIYATERRGVPLDLEAARELRDRSEAAVGDLRARMFELAGGPFNPDAARQIEGALAERGVDLSTVPRTPKARLPMFTADTLAAIEDELAGALLEYRAEKKLLDYVLGLWEHAHGDRLYGTFRQLGTVTGRMSSAHPNLQNIPKSDLSVRYCIAAGEGKVLVGADLDNVELRTLAAFAPGGELAAAFAESIDVHQQTADVLGISRDAGKTMNFATIYGAGPPLIAKRLGRSMDEARAILDHWFEQYPEVRALRNRLWRQVERHGYIKTIGGRRHYWPNCRPNHMLLNRLVSGSCADMLKAAAIELHNAGVPVVLYVHDEVVAEVEEDRAPAVATLLERILPAPMERDGMRVGGLAAKAEIHKRWSDFKQPEFAPWATS